MLYDVVIIGAGFTGLSLAQQLLKELPDISICIVHDGQFPNEEVAFKVGEATIETGAYYLREILGAEYVDKEYFRKMGMRFINTDGNRYKEMGVSSFPVNHSYQFERGRLENDVFALVKDKVEILQNTRFLDVEDDGLLKKIHVVELGKEKKILQAKWLIDASGMRRILTQKYDLSVKQSLPNSSVWFRVDGAVLVDDIYPADTPDAFHGIDRSVSSLHIDGKGYWIWVLRLSDGKTSVGIAFSENIHKWEDLSTLDKTFEWLKRYEPTFYNYLKQKDFPILDFKYLRKYVRMSAYSISKKRFALAGDAFAFIDPVYSGGLDTICLTNTGITDVIAKDMQGLEISKSIDFYNKIYKDSLEAWLVCLDNMYDKKDNWYYIFIKYIIDACMYFGGICPFVMNQAYKDFDKAQQAWSVVVQVFEKYKQVIEVISQKDFKQHEVPDRLNLTIMLFAQINSNIMSPGGDVDALIGLLQDHLVIMKKIYEYVSQGKNLLDLYSPKNYEEVKDWTTWRYMSFFDKAS